MNKWTEKKEQLDKMDHDHQIDLALEHWKKGLIELQTAQQVLTNIIGGIPFERKPKIWSGREIDLTFSQSILHILDPVIALLTSDFTGLESKHFPE